MVHRACIAPWVSNVARAAVLTLGAGRTIQMMMHILRIRSTHEMALFLSIDTMSGAGANVTLSTHISTRSLPYLNLC